MSNEIKPIVVLMGPVSTRSGYGEHTRGIAKSLIESGKYDVKIVPMRWGMTPMTALDNDDPLSTEIKNRFLTSPMTDRPDVHIQVSIPNEFQPMGKYNIGITAGIETTLPRGEWLEGLNRMDLNLVPSKFTKEVFEKTAFNKNLPNGQTESIRMTKPMEVVFEGVDVNTFKKTDEPSQDIDTTLDAIPENFAYLFVGHWLQGDLGADRKDVGMLVKVFCEVFRGKKNPPALILKTSGASFSKMDKDDILRKINKIRQSIGDVNLPNVYLIHGDLTAAEINRLYNHPKTKVHVSFTHGEGFGRPLLEATLSGKPLLTTGWSGHLDFLPANLANLIPGEVKPVPQSAVNEWVIRESGWFVSNYSSAARMMEDMYNNYINYVPKAEQLRAENAKKFTQENEKSLFLSILEKHIPKSFVSRVVPTIPTFKKSSTPVLPAIPQFRKVGS